MATDRTRLVEVLRADRDMKWLKRRSPLLRQARHLLLRKHEKENYWSDGFVAIPFDCEDALIKSRMESL